MHILKTFTGKEGTKQVNCFFPTVQRQILKMNQISNQILGVWIYTNQIPNQLVGIKFQSNQISNQLLWCLWDDFLNQSYDQIVT